MQALPIVNCAPNLPTADTDLLRQAAEMLQRAAVVAERLPDARGASYAWGHLGHLYEEAQRYREALRLTRRAVFAAQQPHTPEALYQWQWQTGRVLRALGRRDEAITAYAQAIRTVQAMRDALPCTYGRDRTVFCTTLGPVYFELADLLLQRAATASGTSAAQVDLQRARRTMEQYKVAELRDYWRDGCVGAAQLAPVSLDVVSREAVVIYPIALPDRLELLVGFAGTLKRFAVPVPADKLERLSRGFRRFVQQGRPAYKRLARTLYDWLIRPFEAELEAHAIETLVFVPDGSLRTVPFAALYDGQRFLIHKYALAMTPGLQLTDPHPLERDSLRVLTAGTSQSPAPGLSALPYVEQELQALGTLAGTRQAVARTTAGRVRCSHAPATVSSRTHCLACPLCP
ncbi:hypothetical protein C2W62_33360 [Candidatus Entotheonella serta]|nr:hypothetical protein C2W62_33360 [Candidatus Entotheonella serta]